MKKLILTVAALGLATAVWAGHDNKGHHDGKHHSGRMMFEKMDTNGDGVITAEEHEASIQQMMAKRSEHFAKMDTDGDGKTDIYGMTIPGINLFINILIGELTKANGGILFDEKNRPHFTDKTMIQTLNFLKELTKYMPPGWEGHGYLETFANMAGGKAAMMYQGYGRGASLIEKYAPENMRSTEYFDVWIKPHGPSGTKPAAQVDEEPWMLFKG
ncbi:hypothetical protein LCGC14_2243670, partial [marine sediment metagenome]